MAEKSEDTSPSETSSTAQDERPSGNWWDSWISSAKSKSAEVYTMVKKDLDEIGSAVKSEASHVLSSTSSAIGKTLKLDVPESPANVMKKSFSTFIGQVSTVLNPEPDDEDDTEVILSSGDTTMLSTYKKELEGLQRVDATFIVPANSPEFDAWRASIEGEVISHAAAANRLRASPLLGSQYNKLVPDAVSHDDFWERYLFRVALLQDRLAAASRRQPLENPSADPVLAHLPMQTTPSTAESTPVLESPKKVLSGVESDQSADVSEVDAAAWADEEFASDVELTEEQQTLLLEEYEREIASKKQQKTPQKSHPTKTTTTDNAKTNTTSPKTNTTTKTNTAPPKTNTSTKTTNTITSITTNTDTTKSKTKSAQTRDKMNNKTDKKNSGKPNATDKKIVNETTDKDAKKPPKTDVCGNNLVEDYFADKEVKDDASANSDESWEKEFEIEDVVQKA